MSVLGVGGSEGKGDKYEVQMFMILYDVYNTFTSHVWSVFHAEYYGK